MDSSPTGIVVLSPHQDDAALSLAASLIRWTTLRIPVHVINVFTISDYAPLARASSTSAVCRLRSTEDATFFAHFKPPIRVTNLDFVDAALRVSSHIPDLLTAAPIGASDVTLQHDIAEYLIAHIRADVVFAPLAVGSHLDHRITQGAALLAVPDGRVAFYEDLPYAFREGASGITTAVHMLTERCRQPLVPLHVANGVSSILRGELLRTYSSQLTVDDVTASCRHTLVGERAWVTASSVNALTWLTHRDGTL